VSNTLVALSVIFVERDCVLCDVQAEAEETIFFIVDTVCVLCKVLATDPETMQHPAYSITALQ
jgi:hypothetical protein